MGLVFKKQGTGGWCVYGLYPRDLIGFGRVIKECKDSIHLKVSEEQPVKEWRYWAQLFEDPWQALEYYIKNYPSGNIFGRVATPEEIRVFVHNRFSDYFKIRANQ